MTVENIISKIKEYLPQADTSKIIASYELAQLAHENQKRLSEEPYISHCLAVANMLIDLKLDVSTVCAGLLHDTIEESALNTDDLKKSVGEEITSLVDGVTKLSFKLHPHTTEQQQADNFRKMLLAMAKDIRVIIIKLVDRLHNMRTLEYLEEDKRKENAQETLEIYAPLAHRLGMGKIKWELEDLSLRYLYPEVYHELAEKVAMKRVLREVLIEEAKKILEEKLKETGIKSNLEGRAKHFYSIYQKIQKENKSFDEIYDLIALRVVVDSKTDCYSVLGVIHALWKPIPGHFKDYIAMPKSNMYQSLHSTVIGPKGIPLEVQIRTVEMHKVAEVGISSHWYYKESGKRDEKLESKLAWLRQIIEWHKELKDSREFMEALKVDLFSDEVFVFTPKGDVKDLPKGATSVDFAYSIHSDVGEHCMGAKVNSKMVPLKYELKNGDIVEIITSASHNPSRDWLKFVKTSKAKSKIKHWFKAIENLEMGRKANG